MRRTMWMLAAVVLVAGCSDGDAATATPTLEVESAWEGDSVTLEVAANLPDGAIVSWFLVDGDDWDSEDAADLLGFATVSSETATATIDVGGFIEDQALIEVGFVPGFKEQPAVVTERYEPNEGASVESSVSR